MKEINAIEFKQVILDILGKETFKDIFYDREFLKVTVQDIWGENKIYIITGYPCEEYRIEKGTREGEISIRIYDANPDRGRYYAINNSDFIKTPSIIRDYLSSKQTIRDEKIE